MKIFDVNQLFLVESLPTLFLQIVDNSMIPLERQKNILNLVQKNEVMSIQDLCQIFDVSYMTIWRDINLLEKEGKVVSISGGIKTAERLSAEPSHNVKGTQNFDEKCAITEIACEKIPENACIYIDAGTTGLALAKKLIHRADLTIITNDLITMNYLVEHSDSQLIHTGGRICKENFSSVGEVAARTLKGFLIDIAFVSASSWNLRGISTPDEDKVPVKEAIAQVSNQLFLLCDSTKYGKVATYLALPITAFDAIFTDKNLPQNARNELKSMGIIIYQ